ncbi:MAG: hypothetical protein ACR2LC_04530 [Pyrinomonadaceae bacterium]
MRKKSAYLLGKFGFRLPLFADASLHRCLSVKIASAIKPDIYYFPRPRRLWQAFVALCLLAQIKLFD